MSFLFEALTQVNNNTFPFQQHFKVTCYFLPLLACVCPPPFKQLIGQQMVWLQNPISKHVHRHAISNMLFNEIFETHHAQILSCFGLKVGTWLTIQLIFPTFWLSSPFFPQCFERDLDYIILQLQVSFDSCAHISLTLWVSTSYVMLIATNTQEPMMQFITALLPLCEMLASMWDENNYMCFLQLRLILLVDNSTLCSPKMTFAF
jgi:hypothetical protein